MSTDYTPDINMESALQDDSYTSTQTNEPIPVQGDNKQVEDPMNASSADSDEQLGKYHVSEMYNHGEYYELTQPSMQNRMIGRLSISRILLKNGLEVLNRETHTRSRGIR